MVKVQCGLLKPSILSSIVPSWQTAYCAVLQLHNFVTTYYIFNLGI